jgi:predicted 3-demethylubiquinone-9 3-methyltransferase (glyoxalase superfamily)
VVNCETQEEVDRFWEKLSEGGEKSQCGWLKDKYGLSWQVVPTVLAELMHGSDSAKSERVMKAMLQMNKVDIQTLKQAANNNDGRIGLRYQYVRVLYWSEYGGIT